VSIHTAGSIDKPVTGVKLEAFLRQQFRQQVRQLAIVAVKPGSRLAQSRCDVYRRRLREAPAVVVVHAER
jgi:hypothetical protein